MHLPDAACVLTHTHLPPLFVATGGRLISLRRKQVIRLVVVSTLLLLFDLGLLFLLIDVHVLVIEGERTDASETQSATESSSASATGRLRHGHVDQFAHQLGHAEVVGLEEQEAAAERQLLVRAGDVLLGVQLESAVQNRRRELVEQVASGGA